jgi:hypothetical protein
MEERGRRWHDRPKENNPPSNNCDERQFLLTSEEKLLQSISARAPLPEVLNGICGALDCQIGNVVSLVSMPGDDGIELATIAMNAADYGLHIFCSGGIVTESGERLGSIEMYSVGPRCPSPGEYQLIERASCLAAIAIKCCRAARDEAAHPTHERPQFRRYLAELPGSMN